MNCPSCNSPKPHLHPAMQLEGEVEPCPDAFHRTVTPENTPAKIAKVAKQMGWATAVLMVIVAGCDFLASTPTNYSDVDDPRPVEQQQGPRYIMNAADFDLETTIGLLKSGAAKDARDLETRVNSGASSINNVDIDHDGKIDYVAVTEVAPDGNHRQMDLVAFPSSRGGKDQVTIASISFARNGDNLSVTGGYPDYVEGYASASFSYAVSAGPTFGDMLFYSWLYSPRPIYVYQPSFVLAYTPRTVIAGPVLTTTRTTYRTETRVGVIPRSAPPANFSIKSAERTRSSLASPSSSSMFGGMKSYNRTPSTTSRSRGSSFFGGGNSSSSSGFSSRPSTPSYRPSSSSSSFGGSSFKPSSNSSFGGSSFRSSSSSSFGGSSFRSSGSSFGGRR